MWSKIRDDPKLVLHALPDADAMQRLIHDLPLMSADDGSGPDDMYLRVLQARPSSDHASCAPAHLVVRRGTGID